MRTSPSPLLPVLRSRLQGDCSRSPTSDPDSEYSITEVADRIGASVKAVNHEAARLVQAGLLADRKVGTSRLVRAIQGSLLTRPLTDLLAVTYGPLPVITEALTGVAGVDHAYIYGSWAARYCGEPGPVPGDADTDDLDERARGAEQVLLREVNIRRVREPAWQAQTDPFVATVRSRPMVELHPGTAPTSLTSPRHRPAK